MPSILNKFKLLAAQAQQRLVANETFQKIDYCLSGTVAITLSTGNVTLSDNDSIDSQSAYRIIRLTGTLSGNCNVIFPTRSGMWTVRNNCVMGGFTITVKTSGGSGVGIGAGEVIDVLCDGTNIIAKTLPASSIAAHASSHSSGGADPVSPASIGAAASSHSHGYADLTGVAATSHNHAAGDINSGTIALARLSFPKCLIYRSGVQSIADNTLTLVEFPQEQYDTDTMHDNVTNNGRITINTAGVYQVGCSISFAANGTGSRILQVGHNGGSAIYTKEVLGSAAGYKGSLTWTYHFTFAANDYIQFYVQQTSGGALNTGVNMECAAWACLLP